MVNLLITIGTMSLQASLIIGLILLLRKLFSVVGIAKKYMMLLWIVPFFFLIFPWKINTDFGFWKQAPIDYTEIYEESGSDAIFNEGKNPIVGNPSTGNVEEDGTVSENNNSTGTNSNVIPGVTEKPNDSDVVGDITVSGKESPMSLEKWLFAGAILWIIGMVTLFTHSVISWMKLKKRLCFSVQEEGNIYRADNIQVPIVFGFISPKIYVPTDIDKQHLEYVVEHEQTHIFRKDPLVKMVLYFIVCIHWFNPFIWIAYIFMVKDMEMACDEETLQRIGLNKKKQYATALLELSREQVHVLEVPLAFAEGDSKRRIKNVLAYRKNVMAIAVLVVLIGLLMFSFFLTKNVGTQTQNSDLQNENQESDKENTEDEDGFEQNPDDSQEEQGGSQEEQGGSQEEQGGSQEEQGGEQDDSSNQGQTEESGEPDYEAMLSEIANLLPEGASLGEKLPHAGIMGGYQTGLQREGYVCENEYQELRDYSEFLVTAGCVCFTSTDLPPVEFDNTLRPQLMLRACEDSYNAEHVGDVCVFEAKMLLFASITIGLNEIPEEDWYAYFWCISIANVEMDDPENGDYNSTWIFLNQECFTKEEVMAIAQGLQ